MFRSSLVVLFITSLISSVASQNSYNIRFNLSELDTASKIACYDLEISNSGDMEWNLANYNIAIFYDAASACFSHDSLLLDDVIYDPARTNIVTSVAGTPLPYEDSLGFIRISLSANSLGILMDTLGTWAPTMRICFELKFEDITSPNTCFQLDINSEELRPLLGVPQNIVQEGDPNSLPRDVEIDSTANPSIIPDRTLGSCFVTEENSEELCTDGIDNDEDGLIDCFDLDGCSPGSSFEIFFNVEPPGCEDSIGFIRVNGASAGSMFSIDGGQSFQSDSLIGDLPFGIYDVIIRKNNISSCEFFTPIMLEEPECDEFDELTCTDGIDNDADGLIDCADPDCQGAFTDVIAMRPSNCPDLNNGSLEILVDQSDVEYSIDSGLTWQPQNTFTNLTTGDYIVLLRNPTTLCISGYSLNPVTISIDTICPLPDEICTDGIDNDQDGVIDCSDPDCFQFNDCQVDLTSTFFIPTAFSPNSLSNNTFGVSASNDILLIINEFLVYDRFGSVVHQVLNRDSADPSHRWNGLVKNQPASPGVYTYVLNYSVSGIGQSTAGSVTLLR